MAYMDELWRDVFLCSWFLVLLSLSSQKFPLTGIIPLFHCQCVEEGITTTGLY